MVATNTAIKPIRVGAFATEEEAAAAVRMLIAAGFTRAEITVICSDEDAESHFRLL